VFPQREKPARYWHRAGFILRTLNLALNLKGAEVCVACAYARRKSTAGNCIERRYFVTVRRATFTPRSASNSVS
jgi:hypothetical protein